MYDNHNRCLEHGSGDYLIFCHADDELLPNCLSDYLDKLKLRNFPDKYVCWGRSVFRDAYVFYWNIAHGKLDEMLVGEHAFLPFCNTSVVPSGAMFSRSSFWKMGGYLPCKHAVPASDWSTMIYLSLNEFVFELSTFLVFRRQEASTNIGHGKKIKLEIMADAFEGLIGKVPQKTFLAMAVRARSHLKTRWLSALEEQVLRHGLVSKKYCVKRLSGLVLQFRIHPVRAVAIYSSFLRNFRV
jgi:glycosyltransferase involved in cell wall biosynthesis